MNQRQVVLDTETTGLEVSEGHRVIEIGAVELVERRRTGRQQHFYLNPQREIDEGALQVHGITLEFLKDKPLFADVAEEFLQFVAGAELVIHNASFDLGFLDAELQRLPDAPASLAAIAEVLDTLELARELHPGQRNSLDALCKRYDIDNSNRSLHGALLDAEILAEVYLAMTGGQADLGLSFRSSGRPGRTSHGEQAKPQRRGPLRVIRATEQEQAEHRARLQRIAAESEGNCLWLQLEEQLESVNGPGQ